MDEFVDSLRTNRVTSLLVKLVALLMACALCVAAWRGFYQMLGEKAGFGPLTGIAAVAAPAALLISLVFLAASGLLGGQEN